MEQKSNKGGRILLALILIVVLCTSAISAVTLLSQVQLQATVKEMLNKNVDSGQEDDVVIAEKFTIRSTLPISDAYKNGTESTLSDRDKETLDMAKNVLSKIIKDDMTDYEKEEAVYLWLTKAMKPDTGILTVIPISDEGADDPHDVLKNRNAVCVGYATTFRLFMQMLDIECKVIHNKELYHSWDLVKLDDEWYHVDCYSDADNANFQNFNMNDVRAEESHDWNHEYFPAATGLKYSYPSMHSVELKNIYAVPKAVRKMFEDKQYVSAFTFKVKIEKDDEAEAAAMISALSDYLSGSDDFFVEMPWSTDADGNYVLSVYINYYNQDDENKVSDKIQAKINDSVFEAFSDFSFDSNSNNDFETEDALMETTSIAMN